MSGFADAPLVGPGSELQLTLDGRAVPHTDIVAPGGPEPSLIGVEGELVDAVIDEPGAGERGEALELELLPAGAGAENLYVAGAQSSTGRPPRRI
ncbi:MAG: hypothetical protein WKF96_12420 [Solirubrobacteraceae bacterium]